MRQCKNCMFSKEKQCEPYYCIKHSKCVNENYFCAKYIKKSNV